MGSIPTSPTKLFWIDQQQIYPKSFDNKRRLSYNRYLGQFNVLCSMVRPAVQRITVVTQPKEVSLRNSASNGSFKQACSDL